MIIALSVVILLHVLLIIALFAYPDKNLKVSKKPFKRGLKCPPWNPDESSD